MGMLSFKGWKVMRKRIKNRTRYYYDCYTERQREYTREAVHFWGHGGGFIHLEFACAVSPQIQNYGSPREGTLRVQTRRKALGSPIQGGFHRKSERVTETKSRRRCYLCRTHSASNLNSIACSLALSRRLHLTIPNFTWPPSLDADVIAALPTLGFSHTHRHKALLPPETSDSPTTREEAMTTIRGNCHHDVTLELPSAIERKPSSVRSTLPYGDPRSPKFGI